MSDLSFPETLKHYRQILWPLIEKHLEKISAYPAFCTLHPKYQSLLDFHQEMVSEYPKRQGKYFRPTMLLLTAQSLGVPLDKALTTAAAMQISEDWILNHDDIEDNSQERRGKPALHRLYGNELAINAGDALHALMWQVLADNYSLIPLPQAQKINREFFCMINRTILGQTIEIKWTKESNQLSDEDIFLIMESKTGYYTIAGPMMLAAILSDASDDQLKQIYHFGVLLGRVFQIIDDILDLTSDFAGLKKQLGNDIYEGKKTLITTHFLRTAKSDDVKYVTEILNKSREEKTDSQIQKVIELIKSNGSLDYAKSEAVKFSKEAENIFNTKLKFLKVEPYRSQIQSAIQFLINRDH